MSHDFLPGMINIYCCGFWQGSERAGQVAGPVRPALLAKSDLVLHNVNTGAFEVYDIAGNTLVGAASLGQVALD